jgi:DNA-binding transcriptional LysR family regulator
MELYQLRAFAAVADSGQLTRAAERLHLSQPALSAQIKALEEELEVRLFERTPNGMQATRVGRELLAHAEKVLAAAEALRQAASAVHGEAAGRLRIGTLSDPQFIRLGDILSKAVERFPLLELELHHEITGAALEAVRDGSLDASFYYGDIASPQVAGLALRELVYCVAAPAEWKVRIAGADWRELAALPWIVTPPISTHHRLLQTIFSEHDVAPAKVIEADNESVISNLVASGLGLSLMREDLAHERERADEVCIWPKAQVRTTLWFIYRAERAADPLIAALLKVVAETWQLPAPAAPEQVKVA